LCPDPVKRLDGDKILAHTWVIGEKTPRKQLPNVTNKIREFNAKRKFRVRTIDHPYRNLQWLRWLQRRSNGWSKKGKIN